MRHSTFHVRVEEPHSERIEVLRAWLNGTLDGLARLEVDLGRTRLLTFHAWGYAGVALAVALTLLLAAYRGLSLWAMGAIIMAAVLAYLDLTALGIGTFLAFGHIGCLMAGCCHGRPHLWGIRYGAAHAMAEFPGYFVGVRLFPIQAVESIWAFVTVFLGSVLVVRDSPAGSALAW